LLPLSSGYLSSAVKTSNHAWYYFKYFILLLVMLCPLSNIPIICECPS